MRVRASGGGAKQQFPHLDMVGKGKELWAWGAEDGSCMEIFSAAVSGGSQA